MTFFRLATALGPEQGPPTMAETTSSARNRPCPYHSPPSTFECIWCRHCGAWKANANEPLTYVEPDFPSFGQRVLDGPPIDPEGSRR